MLQNFFRSLRDPIIRVQISGSLVPSVGGDGVESGKGSQTDSNVRHASRTEDNQ